MAGRERKVPEKFKDREIWSISRLTSFLDCPYGYYLKYILRQRGQDNIYNVTGSCVHEICESLQYGKMTNEEALKQFELSLFQSLEINGHAFPSDKVKDNFIQCLKHYFKHYKPIDAKEFKSEMEFYTKIENHVFVGYIDGVVFNYDDSIEVIDYKTSTKYQAKDLEKHGYQLVLYALALHQEYGFEVDTIKWNMVKYANVTWCGKTAQRKGFWLRNEIVYKLRNEIKKDLIGLGMLELEVELLLDKAVESNDMTLFPQSVQDKYTISDGYIEYPLTTENVNKLKTFVRETIEKISSTPKEDKYWKPKDIDKEGSFFCNLLCGQPSCPHYKEWMESNKDNFKNKPIENNDLLKDLFG
jgi:hypothetical protein